MIVFFNSKSNENIFTIFRFSNLFLYIDKNLTREEIEHLFNKFDENGNNQIEFKEFHKWLIQK